LHAATHQSASSARIKSIVILSIAGSNLPLHQVPGEIAVQYREGKLACRVGEVERELTAATFLFVG